MLSRKALTVLGVLLLVTVPVASQSAPPADQGVFWSQLKGKLEGFAPQKKATVTTAVGGVRGSKDKAADTLYWKGESGLQEVAEAELKAFEQACLAAESGESATALEQFNAFVLEYPQSLLLSDAHQAISRLSEVFSADTAEAVSTSVPPPAAVAADDPVTSDPAPAPVTAPGGTPAPAGAPL